MTDRLKGMRSEYAGRPLSKSVVDADPLVQFDIWFKEAVEAEIPDPNAMVLSTVGTDGPPSSRVVLLKAVEAGEFVFYTNYASRKARELRSNSKVSLLFYWQPLARQVHIIGSARKVAKAISAAYFSQRPRDSQLAAWASAQSREIGTREDLERAFAEAEARFDGVQVPLPPMWGGYRVNPITIEFWQGRPSRLHDRLEYVRRAGGWKIRRLSP